MSRRTLSVGIFPRVVGGYHGERIGGNPFRLTKATHSACQSDTANNTSSESISKRNQGRVSRQQNMSELSRLRAVILDSIFDGIVTTDADALITHANPAAIQLMEWEALDPSGLPVSRVFPLDLRSTSSSRFATLTTGRKKRLSIEYRIAPLQGSDQTVLGFAIIFRSTAALQPAYAAMRVLDGASPPSTEELFEERERSRVTLDAIGDLVLSVDFRGHVNYLNKNAEAITGWTLLEAHGRPLEEVLPLVDATARKPVESPAVRAIIENQKVAIPENCCVLIGRNGAQTAIEASASPIHDSLGGVIGAVIVAHDVTAARDLSAKLTRLALFDELTGLPRRALLADRLQHALARAERNKCVAAVVFLDLDGFKPVNDSLGHSVGDALLKAVAQRLIGCVRSSDTVSRHGGDEFIILLADVRHADEVSCCVAKVRAAFDAPFSVGEHSLQVSASIGAAAFPEMGRNAEELIQCADAAMYENKKNAKAALQERG
jgi:diguanylate cyclase (GGDEF)-like protein/PAS domain S-box-containing protein